jgi:hypothetical protein
MIYLASPYSHENPEVREERFKAACKAAAILMTWGYKVFSPIAHTHPIAQFGLPLDWDYWKKYDEEMIDFCEPMFVLMLPGWEESKGVQAEIMYAAMKFKTIICIELKDDKIIWHYHIRVPK